MNKEQFLLQLRQELKRLPPEDVNDALEYYEEYLAEAGPENEEAAIAAWGSPNRLASQISAEFAIKQMAAEPSIKTGLSTVWVVILAIFASPIALPLAITLAVAVFSFVAVMAALLASLICGAIALTAGGILGIISGFALIATSIPSAVYYIGAGLFLAGLGVTFFIFMLFVSKKGVHTIALFCGRHLPGRNLK